MINMELAQLEDNAEAASRLLTAMANPKRLMVLCNLVGEELTVSALMERVGMAQSPLSQHLSKLRDLDLVAARRDGQQVFYSLKSDDVRRLITTLYDIYCG